MYLRLAKINTRPCRSGPSNTDIYKSSVQSWSNVSSARTRIIQGNVVKHSGLMAREMKCWQRREFADEESSSSRREVGEVFCGLPARFTQKTPQDWHREARSSAAEFSGAPLWTDWSSRCLGRPSRFPGCWISRLRPCSDWAGCIRWRLSSGCWWGLTCSASEWADRELHSGLPSFRWSTMHAQARFLGSRLSSNNSPLFPKSDLHRLPSCSARMTGDSEALWAK